MVTNNLQLISNNIDTLMAHAQLWSQLDSNIDSYSTMYFDKVN